MAPTRSEEEIRLLLAPKRYFRRALPWLIAGTATFLMLITYTGGYLPVAAERDKKDAELKALSGVRERNMSLSKVLAASRRETSRLSHELGPKRALESENRQLQVQLEQNLRGTGVEVAANDGVVTLSIPERLLYKGTELGLTPAGQELLNRLSAVLASVKGRTLEVGAHTDNLPVARRLQLRFPTNWEFTTWRATQIVRFLSEKAGPTIVNAQRLVAVGYGAERPAISNKSAKGRLKNRRIEIRLVPPLAPSEPAAPPAQAPPQAPPAQPKKPT